MREDILCEMDGAKEELSIWNHVERLKQDIASLVFNKTINDCDRIGRAKNILDEIDIILSRALKR